MLNISRENKTFSLHLFTIPVHTILETFHLQTYVYFFWYSYSHACKIF